MSCGTFSSLVLWGICFWRLSEGGVLRDFEDFSIKKKDLEPCMPAGVVSCWPRVDRRWPRVTADTMCSGGDDCDDRGVTKGFFIKAVTAALYVSHAHDRAMTACSQGPALLSCCWPRGKTRNEAVLASGSSGCVIHCQKSLVFMRSFRSRFGSSFCFPSEAIY